jgi:hypothetical protein
MLKAAVARRRPLGRAESLLEPEIRCGAVNRGTLFRLGVDSAR